MVIFPLGSEHRGIFTGRNQLLWLMSISLRIRILLIFGPLNPNTLKKLESEYIFSKLKESVNPIISRHKDPGIQLFVDGMA